MIHPDTKISYINKAVGYGVVATKLIKKGTITWVQDELDHVFSSAEADTLLPHIKVFLDTYSFTNKVGEKIICWDNGKYVNHSFNPSCFTTPFDFEIAIRDIHPGEELTDDYGYLNVEKSFEPIDEGTERKVVYPDDLLTFHAEWDCLLRKNIRAVFKVPQPLIKFIPKNVWDEFKTFEHHPEKLPSLITSYYDRKKIIITERFIS